MGQAAFTIGGQVIGSYFGPIGAAVGGVIGSYIGGALFPEQLPTQEGPRLDDKRVQSSTYGQAIPILFGSVRVASNLIWATELRETETVEELGGKGGGPTQESITYSYDVDVALSLGEGEVFGIRRIWINGTLIYDARSATDPDVLAVYGNDANSILRAIQASGGQAQGFAFYPGNETQLPDPTIEAAEGVGNVPAYRGQSYVVFTGFQLGRWGNRIPQFEFEVVTDGDSDFGERVSLTSITPNFRNAADFTQEAYLPIISDISEGIRVFGANGESVGAILQTVKVYGLDGTFKTSDSLTDLETGYVLLPIIGGSDTANVFVMFDGGLLTLELAGTELGIAGGFGPFGPVAPVDIMAILPSYVWVGGLAVSADRRHILVMHAEDALANDPLVEWFLVRYTGGSAELVDNGTIDYASGSQANRLTFGISPTSQPNGSFASTMMESDLKHIWRQIGSVLEVWEIADDGEMSVILSWTNQFGTVTSTTPMSMNCDDGFCALIGGDDDGAQSWLSVFNRNLSITADTLTVGEVVSRLCGRVDLDPSDIDVSDLTQRCRGMIVSSTMSARAAIESMMRAYNFDAAESGGQIIFRNRDAGSVATLTVDDLGAASSIDGTDLVRSNRAQETELPESVAVLYLAASADYMQGAQNAKRSTTVSVEKAQFELPVVLMDDEAAEAADILLYQSWVGRNTRSFSTTRAWSHLEPTDVVTLEVEDLTATVRITSRKQTFGLIEWTGIDNDVAVFDSNAEGVSMPTPDGIRLVAPTHLHVIDSPALREDDDDAGVYMAVFTTNNGGWTGANVLSGPNLSGPFERATAIFRRASVGHAVTVLGDWLSDNTFDETNTVDVLMFYGEPESATELAVLNGANAAILGNEILQWKNADEIGTGTGVFRLSGLLRARRATEQWETTHALYERFIILDTATLGRLALGTGIIGLGRFYRPVTFGGTQNPIYDAFLSHTGASKLPARVADITGVRAESVGVLFSWKRRDRLAWDWQDLIDLPLNETSERYKLEILTTSGGVPVRTVTDIPNPYYLYTLAQEQEDFPDEVDPLAVIDINVYQVSSTVGPGFKVTKTVTGLNPF